MAKLLGLLKGDRVLWAIVGLLAIFSFLPMYSAVSNLVYVVGNGSQSTFSYLLKHGMLLFLGFCIIYAVHKVPSHYFKGLSVIALPVVLLLLAYTLAQGNTTVDGSNASRWIRIPIVGFTFQTSALASVILMIYVARYLAKIKDKKIEFKESIIPLWVPVFLVLILVLPANFSTAAIIFLMVMALCFLGGYPLKYLLGIVGAGVLGLAMFVLTAKAFPDLFSNRVQTWENRITNFFNPDAASSKEGNYQIERAKMAIVSGHIFGKGSGKSVMKNFLPQSSSDFIFAIVVEEYGLIGGFSLMLLYMFLFFRILVISNGANTIFGKLVVLGVGLPIVFQAFTNMAVAVGLLPVTGQTLPLISSGGTSIWMTCLAIGIVLSVSVKREEEVYAKKEEERMNNPLEILSEQL